MLKTSERLLRLLSLLQVRPFWTGTELAERFEVSTRTVRADIERLRELGYPIDSTPGVAGGYRLGAGAALPPLLLDDEEAIAVAVGLSTAADGSVAGLEEASLRALTKLHQVLPSHLRHRIRTMQSTVVPIPFHGPAVDSDVLLTLASACRDSVQLRFDYRTHSDAESRRIVEPYRLALRAGKWYLLAFDLERDDWRTFRVDRMTPRLPHCRRFTPRALPAEGVADHVDRGVAAAPWEYRAKIVILAPTEIVAARLPSSAGRLVPRDELSCILESGSDDPAALLRHLSMLDLDFSVADTPDLAAEACRLAERFARAAEPAPNG
jgi:predicted DNA-binding transcriptional regulator YafY